MTIHIPGDVPPDMRSVYESNFKTMTHDTGRLMLFAGDQMMIFMVKELRKKIIILNIFLKLQAKQQLGFSHHNLG